MVERNRVICTPRMRDGALAARTRQELMMLIDEGCRTTRVRAWASSQNAASNAIAGWLALWYSCMHAIVSGMVTRLELSQRYTTF